MGPWPLCFLLIFVVNILIKIHSVQGLYKAREQNVGTVLFEKYDANKRCWTHEELTVLNSRRTFQDLLPEVDVINHRNDKYIAQLLDYFHICVESIEKLSVGKTKHLMLKALADTMGGYLHVYILPMTRHAYYVGDIKYRNARRLFELFELLKNFLHTNGAGWGTPVPAVTHVSSQPILIKPTKSAFACSGLITYPVYTKDCGRGPGAYSLRCINRNGSKTLDESDVSESFSIPIPFLDDNKKPNSIALPFKDKSLHSLYAESSAFILVTYYIASVKCIVSKAKSNKELSSFNKEFRTWLKQSVCPHLNDDKWYPAFGGILRVMASLNNTVVREDKRGYYGISQIISLPPSQPSSEDKPPLTKNKNEGEDESIPLGTTELVLIAIAGAILAWLLVGLTLVCYRLLSRNSDQNEPGQSPENDCGVSVLYDNTDYCKPDLCVSNASNLKTVNKMKGWWRRRFGRSSGYEDLYDEERCIAAMSYTSKDSVRRTNSSKSYTYGRTKKCTKAVSVSPSTSPRGCTTYREGSYTSDDTTTNTESPRKRSGTGTSTG